MKTAVDWYSEQLKDKLGQIVINQNWQLFDEIIEQAKEMEKEQIMRTAWHCHIEGVKQCSKTSQEYIQYGEQYYNETFKNQ
jgi:hypothetical protein